MISSQLPLEKMLVSLTFACFRFPNGARVPVRGPRKGTGRILTDVQSDFRTWRVLAQVSVGQRRGAEDGC